ncbi:MAG: TolC family protein [Gemmatimonadaceae bacterium]|nr:TolC family protein [Gemmatimonadaceae bacterium]MCW5826351.1 TolC family protein [Gemmatimonadaceae bacterium]
MTEPTKQQLIEAALRVYGEGGFRGATTKRIAEEAGVNEVTLFRLFGSKAALIHEALQTRAIAIAREALPAHPKRPQAELTQWAAEDHAFLLENAGMIRASMADMHDHPECAGTAAQRPAGSHAELTSYITRLAEHGHIPSAANAKAAATMLMGTLFADAMGRDLMPEMFPPRHEAPAAYVRLFLRALGATVTALLLMLAPLPVLAQSSAVSSAQPTVLSLGDALRMAESKSSAVRAAQAGLDRAAGQQRQVNSQLLPQISGSAAYQRAIQLQFQEIAKQFPDTGSGGGSGGFADSPLAQVFAAPNTFIFTLQGTQNLWTAGRLTAQRAGADAARDAADVSLSSARAQALLDVAQAYYDAVAAQRFADIADSTLALTDRTLAQVRLGREIGTASEFDLLRAQVARDNQRPVAIQARGARQAAELRLKQLLRLPLQQPLQLTTPIRDDDVAMAGALAPVTLADARTVTPDTAVDARATVRQAAAQLRASEQALTAARLARFPALQLSSTYQRFAYPAEGTFLPSDLNLYFPNWTVSLGLSFPVFSGGRIGGERMVAQANVADAQARLEQARDGAEVDAILAITAYEQSAAAYTAAVGTDAQAERAYRIAEVRFAEGISTPVELTEARVQLEQARLQRVTTARDLEVARLRIALLKDLPLVLGGTR